MAAKFIRILAVLAALVVGETVFVGTASATLTSCGGAVGSPQQMVAKWKGMGVFADGSKLIRSGGFSKVDFPSIDKLVAQRAVMAPLASATVVPNTACGGGHMVPFGSRQRPRGYPMAVMLPNNLSKSDRCSHVGRGCKSERVWVFAFGQGLCSNGTHKRVLVVIIIKKVPTKHKPPAHKPPVVTPPPPQGNCNVVIIGNGNNVSACNVTIVIICSGVNVVIGGPDSNSVNQAVQQYEQSHNCNVKAPPPPPVVPPPPPHHTQITCTGFEEISGGGSFLVDCDVSSDNGAPISLSAHSNDSNTRVSGINCISNGGTPSCPGNGTYEFRVTGNNSGSTILYSSITAVASANGVPATFTSDPFPVDPSGGGF